MTPGALYVWGCLGGLGAGVVVYVLPPIAKAVEAKQPLGWSRAQYGRTFFLLVILTAVSGLGPLLVAKVGGYSDALKLGAGAQAALKGLFAGLREATPAPGARRRRVREPT